jgi:hypothetical protein
MMTNMRRIMTMALVGMLLFSGLAKAQSREAARAEFGAKLDKAIAAEHSVIDTMKKLKRSRGSPDAGRVTDYCVKLQDAKAAHDYRVEAAFHMPDGWDDVPAEAVIPGSLSHRIFEDDDLVTHREHLGWELEAMGVKCSDTASPPVPPAPQSPKAPEDTTMPGWLLAICFTAGALIYFAPSVIGNSKANRWAIFMLNLLLGWTILGWIIAMVWAFCAEPSEKPVLSHSTNGVKSQKAFCRHCGSPVTTAFCGNCGVRTAL